MKMGSVPALAFAAAILICLPALADSGDARSSSDAKSTAGRELFLRNCAHCHGADGHGDEGTDLHKLDEPDTWIATRIRQGKAGEMTAFAGKLQPTEINSLVEYLRTLK